MSHDTQRSLRTASLAFAGDKREGGREHAEAVLFRVLLYTRDLM